jgi:hypothetical protein
MHSRSAAAGRPTDCSNSFWWGRCSGYNVHMCSLFTVCIATRLIADVSAGGGVA